MKNKLLVCFFIMTFSTLTFADFAYFPIEKRVSDNNLIVIGTLQNISETETDELEINNGSLLIESVIYGNFVNSNHQKLQKGNQINIEWRNPKMTACKFGFAENQHGIWFLNVDNTGKIESLTNNSSSSLGELSEVTKHVKKKSVDKVSKKIELLNDDKEADQSDFVTQDETVMRWYKKTIHKTL